MCHSYLQYKLLILCMSRSPSIYNTALHACAHAHKHAHKHVHKVDIFEEMYVYTPKAFEENQKINLFKCIGKKSKNKNINYGYVHVYTKQKSQSHTFLRK